MKLLGIDTSTNHLSVCLTQDEKLVILKETDDKFGHIKNIFSLINDCLRESDNHINDVQGIVLNIGPGSFTGLRIGLSVAKGLIFEKNIDLYCYTIFDQLSYNFTHTQKVDDFIILIQCRNDEFYYSTFETQDNQLKMINPIGLIDFDNLISLKKYSKNLLILEENKYFNDFKKIFENIYTLKTNSYLGNLFILLNKEKYKINNIDTLEPLYYKEFIPKL